MEQHVAMTKRQEDAKTIEGKKVCWNFRKGRCRFGHKCTFAHDSDVGLKKRREEAEAIARAKGPTIEAKATSSSDAKDVVVVDEDGGEDHSKPKKKRPGLSDGIVPSKKAMKFHNKVYRN